MRQQLGTVCGCMALLFLCAAAVLSVPDTLMGMGKDRSWPFSFWFVACIWLSALLISRPLWFASIVTLLAFMASATMRAITYEAGLKETYAALWLYDLRLDWLERLPAGVFELGAFLAAGLFVGAGLLLQRDRPQLDVRATAIALLAGLGALVLADIVGSLSGFSQFLDPLDLVLATYLFPLMVSAFAVLAWGFVTRLSARGKPAGA